MSAPWRRYSKPAARSRARNFNLWQLAARLTPFVNLELVGNQNNPESSAPLAAEDGAAESVKEQAGAPVSDGDKLSIVTAARDQLAKENAELQDRLLRARAEFDNARRRAERERSDYLQFAAMDLVRDILPIADDFERALKVETADRNYAKGVELIYQRMSDSLKKLGLEPIETEWRIFDPNVHQAVERVPTEEAEDQTILGEFQRGYNFKGKLLRPAMVRVAVRS
jgi:molecular chaperone GrpE